MCSYAENSALPYLISGAVAIILMVVFVIPTRSLVAAAERVLDRGGATSVLTGAMLAA